MFREDVVEGIGSCEFALCSVVRQVACVNCHLFLLIAQYILVVDVDNGACFEGHFFGGQGTDSDADHKRWRFLCSLQISFHNLNVIK